MVNSSENVYFHGKWTNWSTSLHQKYNLNSTELIGKKWFDLFGYMAPKNGFAIKASSLFLVIDTYETKILGKVDDFPID